MLISEKPTKATILHENLDFLMAESKTKSQKLSPKKDTWVDRISDLPESLICHILSFLPIQEVVATSILSSRWQHLWTLFSRLDLDSKTIGDSLSCNQGQCKPFSFGHIVSTLLTLHRAPYLRTLRLKCFLCRNCSRLDKWIGNVVERNLEELDLEIYGDYLFWKLPQSIFSCKTLVVLNLNGAIVLDPPPSFQFPSLKILRLVQIVYRPDSVFRLLSGCPVLEELSFQRQALKAVFKHKICASTLKRLSITFGQHDFDGSDFGSLDYKLEINAPALEYFKFQGHLRDIVFLHKLDSLVQADVYISSFEAHTFGVGWEDDRHRNECCADRVFNFLAALYNVKLLSFSSSSLKCLSYGSACLSQFQNLVQLDFKVYAWTWHMLQALLQNAPNLEVLFVTHKSRGYLKHNVCWKEPPDDPNNLTSCLTSFCYKGFVFEHVLEFVKYILKEARVLKKATIHVRGHDRKLKESIVKKISTFPRCSMTCLLTVN